jgi:flavodoxin
MGHMEILVAYEGRRGRARQAADAVADAAASRGVAALIRAIDEVEPAHLTTTAAVIAGCWTVGKVPFGDRPTRRMARWVETLPPLDGKPVGLFCTYRFFPHTFADMTTRTAETLHDLSHRFELNGAKVVATRSINLRSIDSDAAKLVDRTFEHLPG